MELTPETFIAGAAVLGAAFKIVGKLVDTLVEKIVPPKDTIIRFSAEFEIKFAQMVERIMAIDISTRHLERTADGIDGLNERFEAHDKSDAMFFTKIQSDHQRALEMLDVIRAEFTDHDRRVMEAIALQRAIESNTRPK